jgi:ABC-type bacteriocin/lantibiotic exporter with double-glycine peptidase domain
MKNLLAVYNTFTGQLGPDDCGIACLSMLLKYSGRYEDSDKLSVSVKAPAGGLSLYDLRTLAADFKLDARCVRMDKKALRSAVPCILHAVNSGGAYHFVVCFDAKHRRGGWRYLIGDPARGITWIGEYGLDAIWHDGAALFIENLRFRHLRMTDHVWSSLFRAVTFQKMLFISIPLLNLCAAALGVALSWLLQRGINDSLTGHKTSLLIAIITLLCIIMLAKSLGNYLKQRLLIRLNSDIRRKYLAAFFRQVSRCKADDASVRKGFADVQKIQSAVTALFAVLFSEGTLVTLLLAGMWFFEPVAGLISTLYAGIMILTGIRHSAMVSWHQGGLTEAYTFNEKSLLEIVTSGSLHTNLLDDQLSAEHDHTARISSMASSISKYHLWYECMGTLAVILMLSFGLYNVRQGLMSYNVLMTEVIIGYFITILTPRICQVFPLITEGARLSRKFGQLS